MCNISSNNDGVGVLQRRVFVRWPFFRFAVVVSGGGVCKFRRCCRVLTTVYDSKQFEHVCRVPALDCRCEPVASVLWRWSVCEAARCCVLDATVPTVLFALMHCGLCRDARNQVVRVLTGLRLSWISAIVLPPGAHSSTTAEPAVAVTGKRARTSAS